jgi:hypothetical protein
MSEPVDHEVEAIKVVLAALAPLSEKARASVLDYVMRRLDVPPPVPMGARTNAGGAGPAAPIPPASGIGAPATVHIKEFKEQKRPRSANEMAAVVAYYLANLAPEGKRKNTINQKDVETYFKIAVFPLPQQVRKTLANAKNSGYFDLVGDGEYKLNAVGHNLVAHSMPRGASKVTKAAKRRPQTQPRLRKGKRS